MSEKVDCVYILANKARASLYIGISSRLRARVGNQEPPRGLYHAPQRPGVSGRDDNCFEGESKCGGSSRLAITQIKKSTQPPGASLD